MSNTQEVSEKAKAKAQELYNTYKTVLGISDTPTLEERIKIRECVKACIDKLLIEVTGNKDRTHFYYEVKRKLALVV